MNVHLLSMCLIAHRIIITSPELYKIDEVKSMNQDLVKQQEALNHVLKKLSIPEGYDWKEVRSGKQDGVDVWVFRYEKSNGENNGLKGEHYSFTVTQDTYKILGVMWMDQRFEKGQPLPSHEKTREIVKGFL